MPTVTVFFRFDDFSETSPVAVEAGLVNALRKNGMSATFAVIPAVTEGRFHDPTERAVSPLGASKIQFLRRAVQDGAVDVALHGWNHRSRSHASPHSEFMGMPATEQATRIRNGRDLLRDQLHIDARVFVPPWNRYDGNTLQALIDQNFTCLSANRYGRAAGTALRFLPTTADIREVRSAVMAARNSGDSNPIVGVLLHPYDFAESGDARGDLSCDTFDRELQWLGQQPDVRVVSIASLSRENETLDVTRYEANQPLSFETIFPPYVQATEATPFFRSTRSAQRVKARRALTAISTYAVMLAIAALLARWIFVWLQPHAPNIVALGKWLSAALLTGLVIRAAVRGELYFRTMAVLAVLAGVVLAGIL